MDSAGLMELAECQRIAALDNRDPNRHAEYGQFFTPIAAAQLIASMAGLPDRGTVRVLDPGAGSGILSAALIARILKERPDLEVQVTAVERDATLLPFLAETLRACEFAGHGRVSVRIVESDFIIDQLGPETKLQLDSEFDLVVQNPPYGKLGVNSVPRMALRAAGMDASNLYAAFLSLSVPLLRDNGQIIAITPRSFFNGPYFSSFRKSMLNQIALDRVHVFESRSTVFADTGVLQENVIFSGTRNGQRKVVELSISRDHRTQIESRKVPYAAVINPDDGQQFVRLTIDSNDSSCAESMLKLPCTLADLNVDVSTGRVVDFRSRGALRNSEADGGFPLIYPGNLRDALVDWPRSIRKSRNGSFQLRQRIPAYCFRKVGMLLSSGLVQKKKNGELSQLLGHQIAVKGLWLLRTTLTFYIVQALGLMKL